MLEAGQASKFFRDTRRSGQQVIPKLDTESSAQREESRVLDDPAIAIRNISEPAPVGDSMVPEEDREVRSEEELRASLKNYDQLCQKYHHGEPCIRPDGHPADGPADNPAGHKGMCWGRHNGLPCNQPDGHEGNHTPMTVNSRSDEGEGTEVRSDEAVPEPTTLSGPQAMAQMFTRKKGLTQLPD